MSKYLIRKQAGVGAMLPVATQGTWSRYIEIPEEECYLSPWGDGIAVDTKEKARRFKTPAPARLLALKLAHACRSLRGFVHVEEEESSNGKS